MRTRERDGRGPTAHSVRAVVASVHFGLRAARLAECLLFAVAAALLTCAAGVASRVALVELVGPALVSATCAFVTWWCEHPLRVARTAGELDSRLRHHGALVTAFELEQRAGALAPLEELVRARVLARLRQEEAVRALFPPLFWPLAAPVAAGLLFYFVSAGGQEVERVAPDYSALAGGLEQALALRSVSEESTGIEGQGEDGGLSSAQASEVFEALHARAALPFSAEDWQRDPAGLLARVDELDRKLSELGARAERGSELAERIEAARPWLDALRQGLQAEEAARGGPGSAPEAGTGGTTRGTIGGSAPVSGRSTPAPSSPSPTPSVPEPLLGLQAGSWWPAEYDGLVARWVELSRAERQSDDQR